jgi:hypothetical protein
MNQPAKPETFYEMLGITEEIYNSTMARLDRKAAEIQNWRDKYKPDANGYIHIRFEVPYVTPTSI